MYKQKNGISRARFMSYGAAVLAAGLLAACQSPPAAAPAPDPKAQREQVLRAYGFSPTDDGWELQMADKLLFAVDSDVLLGERRATVLEVGRALVAVGVHALRVEGHADDQGSVAYNEALSLRRAQAAAAVLVEAGLAKEHVSVRGFGKSRPLAVSGALDAKRKENRRVSIIVPAQ